MCRATYRRLVVCNYAIHGLHLFFALFQEIEVSSTAFAIHYDYQLNMRYVG